MDHLEIIGEVIGTCLGNNKSQVFGQKNDQGELVLFAAKLNIIQSKGHRCLVIAKQLSSKDKIYDVGNRIPTSFWPNHDSLPHSECRRL